MIAGGTGVTPMYQVAKAILKDATDKTQISLLFANVSADDILIEDLLSELQAQTPQFKVRGYLQSCWDMLLYHMHSSHQGVIEAGTPL